ncbi:MAG: hypothetical protein ACRD3T_13170 [Terriglobia bacterium]
MASPGTVDRPEKKTWVLLDMQQMDRDWNEAPEAGSAASRLSVLRSLTAPGAERPDGAS